jgi:Protein of unknown function (DUF4236)
MTWRFRKRIKILPGLWINLNKGAPQLKHRRPWGNHQYREERGRDHARRPGHWSFLPVRAKA